MSQSEPKISVIMPSLNVGDYMDQCILSVINQTLDDIEIICIDAGSTDGTIEIINKYAKKDPRITLINTDVKSYGYQVNLGIKHAKGKYISIVETDDYIAKDMFKSLYDLSEDETVDIIKSNFYHRYDYYFENENEKTGGLVSIRVDRGKKVKMSVDYNGVSCLNLDKQMNKVEYNGFLRKQITNLLDIELMQNDFIFVRLIFDKL